MNYPLTITIPSNLLINAGTEGPFFVLVKQLNATTNDNRRFKLYSDGGTTYFKVAEPNDATFKASLPLSTAILIVESGGDVEGYPCVLGVSNPNSTVPSEFPNRTYVDEQDVTQTHTYNSYKLPGFTSYPMQIGNTYYFHIDSLGEKFKMTDLISVKTQLLSVDDYINLLPDEEI